MDRCQADGGVSGMKRTVQLVWCGLAGHSAPECLRGHAAVARHGRSRPGHRARQRSCYAGEYPVAGSLCPHWRSRRSVACVRRVFPRRALRLRLRPRRRAYQDRPARSPHRQAHHAVGQCHRRLDLAGRPHRRGAELHAGRHQGLRRRHAGTARRSAGRVRAGQVLQGRGPGRRSRQQVRLRPVRRRRDLGHRLFRSEAAGDKALSRPGCSPTTAGDAGWAPFPGRPVRRGRHRLLDLWQPEKGARKILEKYGRGEEKLPVFKMPHLRGWSVAAGRAWLPAIGRHEVLVADATTWKETGGSRSRASRCSSWPVRTAARYGSISPSRTTAGCR
jgi:hypothetical protein